VSAFTSQRVLACEPTYTARTRLALGDDRDWGSAKPFENAGENALEQSKSDGTAGSNGTNARELARRRTLG
jgi:hypothetical protein